MHILSLHTTRAPLNITMRFFIVVLGLSTLAVAGPLPSLSKNALKARAQSLVRLILSQTKKANASTSQTLANSTFNPDSIAALSKLDATYDSVNNQAPGLKVRSSDSTSVSHEIYKKGWADIEILQASANITLGPDVVATLNELKLIYNNLNAVEHSSTLVEKRDFDSSFEGVEDKLAEEGLWPRSSVSDSIQGEMSADNENFRR